MGSLQSAILGFGIFKLLESNCAVTGLTMEENVIVQTTAVATATMPLAAGGPAKKSLHCSYANGHVPYSIVALSEAHPSCVTCTECSRPIP